MGWQIELLDLGNKMFQQVFCSSPWLHMRITPDGSFNMCRWGISNDSNYNIKTHTIKEYFQDIMSSLRTDLLNGQKLSLCDPCLVMDQHGKVSGRQRQLLKTGIHLDHFQSTLQCSPFVDEFRESWKNQGKTNLMPVDWQIDLGNFCNSACVMCSPRYSSRLAQEFHKIGFIKNLPPSNWTDDTALVEKFCQGLTQGPAPVYLHFLGGETLIVPAFKTILENLLAAGMKNITIGFTTNLTVWPQDVIDLLKEFSVINVGLSIESLSPVNEYVRWPAVQSKVLGNLERWIDFGKNHGSPVQLRLTPSALTILHVADLYQYAWDHNVGVETCNFIYKPRCLTLKVLPDDLRSIAIERLQSFVSNKNVSDKPIINTRNPSTLKEQVIEDAISYINYLKNSEYDQDGALELVQYIKKLEESRKNRILDYLPEYEKFLRSNGY